MRAQSAFERFSGATHHAAFSFFLVVLRVAIGLQFFYAGVSKFMEEGWSAAGYLERATGPFAPMFQAMAGSPLVDQLNMWGLTLIGVALILGLLVRPAAIFGMALMELYFWAGFETNTAHGWIEEHGILFFVFAMFAAGGAGHVFGLNGFAQEYFRKKSAAVRWLFG